MGRVLSALYGGLLLSTVTFASWAQDDPSDIALTFTNDLPVPRAAEPVACGVPLVPGYVERPEELSLLGPGGDAVPMQVSVSSAFADGTPRWVLARFLADVPVKGTATYRLSRGVSADVGDPLVASLQDGTAVVRAGEATFRVGTRRFRFLNSVAVAGVKVIDGGRGGLVLEEEGGTIHADDIRVTSAEFEETGPLRAVLCIRGEIAPREPLPLAEFVCRLYFHAGKSEVRAFLTIRNPAAHNHGGNHWDLGTGGSVFMEDLSLTLPLAGGLALSRIGVRPDSFAFDATKLYQDSSGGPNWDSPNHVDKDHVIPTSFRGYRVDEDWVAKSSFGNDLVLHSVYERTEAGRADGWLHARTDAGGVAVGVRDFWQNFPKALERTEDGIRVGLWPREYAGVHELLGGEQKTHEMLFVFHGPDVNDEAVEQRMNAFHHPLYAMPDPAAVYATRAFWPTAPLDRSRFAKLEETCDTFVDPVGTRAASVITKWDQIDEYGWRHFGDTFADNEASPEKLAADFPEHHFGRQPISHFGNEYDVAYGVMLQGLRRADPRWMWLADVLCRHYSDICIYHTDVGAPAYGHGPFTHTTHDTPALRSTHRMYPSETDAYEIQYASGGPNAGHCYVASLAQHYYLTGDQVSREAFLEVADWSVESPWFTDMMMGDKRGIGNFLMAHVYAYQLTGDSKYYDAALAMLDQVREPFEGLGATLFAKAAGRFLDMKIENDQLDDDYLLAREKLLTFGDLYLELPDEKPDRWLEQTCFYAEVLFTCYLHAPGDHPNRDAYLAKGRRLMDHAADRWPGTYTATKSLIMCFGNTGAYMKAISESE